MQVCALRTSRLPMCATSSFIRPLRTCVPLLPRTSCSAGSRHLSRLLITKASNNESQQRSGSTTTAEVDPACDNLSGEYCSLDSMGKRAGKRTIGEMEQEFLEALSSYYFEGKPTMTDEEFSVLKDELLWNGSKVAILDSTEQKFLEAVIAYRKGKPIISDQEYDTLKAELKQKGSIVTAEGPRCSIRSKKMYSDAEVDYTRLTLLNLPAILAVLGVVFAVDDLSGFEITKLIELPPPYGVVLLWGLLLPVLFVIAQTLTNVAFTDALIVKGNCPNCGAENFTYFGDVLSVRGNRGQNAVDCGNCGAGLLFDEYKRLIVVNETPEERAKKAPAGGKKAGAGAKKKAAAAAKNAADSS